MEDASPSHTQPVHPLDKPTCQRGVHPPSLSGIGLQVNGLCTSSIYPPTPYARMMSVCVPAQMRLALAINVILRMYVCVCVPFARGATLHIHSNYLDMKTGFRCRRIIDNLYYCLGFGWSPNPMRRFLVNYVGRQVGINVLAPRALCCAVPLTRQFHTFHFFIEMSDRNICLSLGSTLNYVGPYILQHQRRIRAEECIYKTDILSFAAERF